MSKRFVRHIVTDRSGDSEFDTDAGLEVSILGFISESALDACRDGFCYWVMLNGET